MYVCICNAVREMELRETVQKGARSAEDGYAHLGIDFACAQCRDHAQFVIDDELLKSAAN
ncbi:MAG: hypothetical protein CMM52_10635 [Rhodospirillaceae bacterium]|nr:hypothetical protein [Rhodospirillaceae bacterium]